MSDFFEDVLKPEPALTPSRPGGLGSPSPGRFAALLALMAGLTAVPTWIMLRAGVNGLDGATVTAVSPLLDPVPTAPVIPLVPKAVSPQELAPPISTVGDVPVVSQVLPDPPPEPPVLERKSVVDTSIRPARREPVKPAAPAIPDVQAPDVQPPQVIPPAATVPAPPSTAWPDISAPGFMPPTVVPPDAIPPDVAAPGYVRPGASAPDFAPPGVMPPNVMPPDVIRPEVLPPLVIPPAPAAPRAERPVPPAIELPWVNEPDAGQSVLDSSARVRS